MWIEGARGFPRSCRGAGGFLWWVRWCPLRSDHWLISGMPPALWENSPHLTPLTTGRRARGEDWGREHAALFARDGEAATGFLPRCLEMISAEDVIRRIELYFEGGALRELTEAERRACAEGIAGTREHA